MWAQIYLFIYLANLSKISDIQLIHNAAAGVPTRTKTLSHFTVTTYCHEHLK